MARGVMAAEYIRCPFCAARISAGSVYCALCRHTVSGVATEPARKTVRQTSWLKTTNFWTIFARIFGGNNGVERPTDAGNSRHAVQKGTIFISYRRRDAKAVAFRIYDTLLHEFGAEAVFIDMSNIRSGYDFRSELDFALKQSTIMLIIIGEHWLELDSSGVPRINNESDAVRKEVAWALERRAHIIPVLVGSAKMPEPDALPDSLSPISYLNAVAIDEGKDFHNHIYRLIVDLREILKLK